jgi:hypothetical protein
MSPLLKETFWEGTRYLNHCLAMFFIHCCILVAAPFPSQSFLETSEARQ